MPTYIALMNWTDQGIRSVKDTVQRREQAEGLAQKHGARIEEVYWTVGPYDLVTILEAPRRRECHRDDARAGLGGKLEDHDASCLRPRGDVGNRPTDRLRPRAHRAGAATLRPFSLPLFTSEWKKPSQDGLMDARRAG